jgi:O-antigen ligase
MLLAHPLVGVGLDRFGPEYYSHYLPAYVKEFSEHYPLFWGHFHAHNNFLNFAAETGCLGLFSFLFLLFSILKLVYLKWKHLPSLHPGKNLSLGIFISLLTFLIHGLFDFTFKAESLALFWFLTGLVLRIDEEKS